MRKHIYILAFLMISLIQLDAQIINGELSENQIIKSKVLGYDLQYRVYTPPGYDNLPNMPVIYLTDGQWYIEGGTLHWKIDKMVGEGTIKPVIAVFVDARDPHDLTKNRRRQQFLGKDEYVKFYEKELVPKIQRDYKAIRRPNSRAIMGLSLGGLNATYFGAKASKTFGMLGIQSPALGPVKEIHDLYLDQDKLPLKIFLTTGTINDTEVSARRLKKTLETKGYDFKYIEVPQGHDWLNWKPLLDDALLYFFGWKKG